MAQLYWKVQHPVPYILRESVISIVQRVRKDRVVLYNVIDDFQRMHQRKR